MESNEKDYFFESVMARIERTNKRLFVLCVLLVVLLVGTNIAWLVYESQYDVEEITTTQDVSADDAEQVLVNNGGDLNYGGTN